jgi:ABC-type dipeptide/oligopeptide/nickel transport system permease component
VRTYLLRRLALFVPTLLLASLAVFGIMRALPGDVTAVLLGGEGEALRPEFVAALREELGLDAPLGVQYVRWAWQMVNGEFGGTSIATREPIRDLIARALPVTGLLVVYAGLLAVLISVPLGAFAALNGGRWPDLAVRTLSVLGGALPGFWVALLALLLVVALLRWSPPLIYAHPWHRPLEHLEMMAIPALVLAWEFGGHLTRITRAGTLEALQQDHVRTATGKGLRRRTVLLRHALRTAAIPVVTVAGLHIGALLGGAVILEFIFGLPGLGRGLVEAVVARDYPVVQSLALLLVALVLLLNLLVDLLYAALDPRISYAD